MIIKNAFKHFKTITTHKYYVFQACWKAGIPWQGITHDLSKYSPTEFFNNIKYYKDGVSPVDVAKKEVGYSMAWMHHRGRNPHHYEYWIDYLDDGGKPIPIPYKYAVEMVCDYIGAGKAYNKEKWTKHTPLNYWVKVKRPVAKIHPATVLFMDYIFEDISQIGLDALDKENTLALYTKAMADYMFEVSIKEG